MTRTLVVLGCAALLAMGLSTFTFAGSIPDADSDGVPDQFDNCSARANGPLGSPNFYPNCDGQQDGDLDGYGNTCDTDVNNDGGTGLSDVSLVFAAVQAGSTALNTDINCDGGAGLSDVSLVFAAVQAAAVPGPSGLACAGTIPCVAQ